MEYHVADQPLAVRIKSVTDSDRFEQRWVAMAGNTLRGSGLTRADSLSADHPIPTRKAWTGQAAPHPEVDEICSTPDR